MYPRVLGGQIIGTHTCTDWQYTYIDTCMCLFLKGDYFDTPLSDSLWLCVYIVQRLVRYDYSWPPTVYIATRKEPHPAHRDLCWRGARKAERPVGGLNSRIFYNVSLGLCIRHNLASRVVEERSSCTYQRIVGKPYMCTFVEGIWGLLEKPIFIYMYI